MEDNQEYKTEINRLDQEIKDVAAAPYAYSYGDAAISIEELCKKDFPPQHWIVENLFTRETINQLSAPPNNWKTWVTLHIALCIAQGKPVFDKFATEQRGVMIVNEEDPAYLLKDRLIALQNLIVNLPIYIHSEKGIKLEDYIVEELIVEMKEKGLGVVVLDSLSVLHSGDENKAQDMGSVFDQIKKFIREGITVIFTNHHRKKSRQGGMRDDIQEQTRGSTVINAVPAGHITCEEKKNGDKISLIIRQAKLKGAKKLNPFIVSIQEEGDKISFVFEGEYEEGADAATKLRERIYEIINGSDRWLGVVDLKEATGRSEKPIRDQLAVLVKDKQIQREQRSMLRKRGEIVSDGSGAAGLYFRIKPEEEAAT